MKEDVCGICKQDEPPKNPKQKGAKKKKSNEDIGWIGCDSCNKWFHKLCVRIGPALLALANDYVNLCAGCSIVGSLLPRTSSSSTGKCEEIQMKIEELSSDLSKIRSELQLLQSNIKKQLDRFRSKLLAVNHLDDRRESSNKLVENIEKKLELIETGAKLAGTCSNSVNCCRIAINKVPHHPNESGEFPLLPRHQGQNAAHH